MPKYWNGIAMACCAVQITFQALLAQTVSANLQNVRVTIVDTTDTAIESATASLANAQAGAHWTRTSNTTGSVEFNGVPSGVYKLTVSARGFEDVNRTISIRPHTEAALKINLDVAHSNSAINVSDVIAGRVELSPTASGTLGRSGIDSVPIQNQATGLSEIVTRTAPGVAADGNGFAHPLGEHADTSLSIDNQPITDQQAKIFSNQLSASIVQSMEVITGAPPAEYGDKTSLIMNVTTQSGFGKPKPFGSIVSGYGSFGTWSEGITYGIGSARWGNFTAVNTSGSGRFLDSPEFLPMHDHGNAESIFDRLDWQATNADMFHLNVSVARSWFQTPNTFDAEALMQDQRSQIRSFNVAPAWTRVVSPSTVITVNPFVRFDRSQYFPSSHSLSDFPATLSQSRYLVNIGFRGDLAYSRGVHNAKAGLSFWRTQLREDFTIALTDPAYNALCLDGTGKPASEVVLRDESQCNAAGYRPNPDFIPNLLPFDLSRGGSRYGFHGAAAIKELAFYAQDSIKLGRISLNPGLRFDQYKGLSSAHQLQPRFGLAYRTPVTNTILRLSYARLFETPYNENLIVASEAASNPDTANPFGTFRSSPPRPGQRNQFNAGLAQAIGSHLSIDADYFWKFTTNAFDFDSLFLTPITFPIGWRKSKIDGLAARITLDEIHGFSAYVVMGHTRSRFFGPENGGLIFNRVPDSGVFRIDHSEEFEHTAFLRYQPRRSAPWVSFTWRFNSGLALPGVVPTYQDALSLTADEQAQMGLFCGSTYATLGHPITSCSAASFGATRVAIPPPGTQNDDLRPTRVMRRNLFDASIGTDNLLRVDRHKLQTSLTVLNLTNEVALYNFLSTFSGTHFVTPRMFQAEIKYVF